ncbi:hypothetical protein CSKR_110717 [Clonorchis sinensis]|uniref:Uncharacterized protein n=1 Tax=Clonorchis sinensis TaxID=79923 RepID=A0A8T1M9F3_CLOSI|nr:hypothetical protein CSKR_110717 [Clonorchis sinensis]
MSKSHDSSDFQPPGSSLQGNFRPSGGVSLFGANRGLLGEMKARIRGDPNDGSDTDSVSSPPTSTSPPSRANFGNTVSPKNENHPSPPKTSPKGGTSPSSGSHIDHRSPSMKLPSSRRNPSNTPEAEVQQRTPKRIQSMYVNSPHIRLGEVLRNKPINEPLSANSARTSSPPSSSTATNTESLLSSLTKNRARRPRTRPPTVHWMPNVPFPNEDDKVHRDTNEEKILSEFFSNQHETGSPR